MRLMIAQFGHETNTFSPLSTPVSSFAHDGRTLLSGDAAKARLKGAAMSAAGFLDAAAHAGAATEIPLAGYARPGGPVSDDAFETCAGRITDAVAGGGFDGIMLDLHGAMVTESFDDGEAELLKRIRSIDATVPIALSLDMHANISEEMVRLSTIIAGFHRYPHTDIAATGRRAGELLIRTIRGEAMPQTAWGRLPMLPHMMTQGTYRSPNRELQGKAAAWEASGRALAVSVFMGFQHADVATAGLSVVATADRDRAEAEAMRDVLLAQAWAARHDFVFAAEPLGDAVARAKRLSGLGKPVILLDYQDTCGTGGTMDSTAVLAAILDAGLPEVAFFGIVDPEAVAAAIQAGPGERVQLSVGGRYELKALGLPNPPLRIDALVKRISDGNLPSRDPSAPGIPHPIGPTVVLDLGNVELVVLSTPFEPAGVDTFAALGIDPSAKRFLAIKSRVHWRMGLEDLAGAVVELAGNGPCLAEMQKVPYRKLTRPIFPLEAAGV